MDQSITAADVTRLVHRLERAESAVDKATLPLGEKFPHYAYPAAFEELFNDELCGPRWRASGYDPETDASRLADTAFIAAANLDELRRLLTAAERLERFCDGWWLEVVRQGWLHPVVRRLRELTD